MDAPRLNWIPIMTESLMIKILVLTHLLANQSMQMDALRLNWIQIMMVYPMTKIPVLIHLVDKQ